MRTMRPGLVKRGVMWSPLVSMMIVSYIFSSLETRERDEAAQSVFSIWLLGIHIVEQTDYSNIV